MELGGKLKAFTAPKAKLPREEKPIKIYSSKICHIKDTKINEAALLELPFLVNKLLLGRKDWRQMLPLVDIFPSSDSCLGYLTPAAVIVVDITGNLLLICGL